MHLLRFSRIVSRDGVRRVGRRSSVARASSILALTLGPPGTPSSVVNLWCSCPAWRVNGRVRPASNLFLAAVVANNGALQAHRHDERREANLRRREGRPHEPRSHGQAAG